MALQLILFLLMMPISEASTLNFKALCPYDHKNAVKLFHRDSFEDFSKESLKAVFDSVEKRNGVCQSFAWAPKDSELVLTFKETQLHLKLELKGRSIFRLAFGVTDHLNDSFEKIFSPIAGAGIYLSKNNQEIFAKNEAKDLPAGELIRLPLLHEYWQGIAKNSLDPNQLLDFKEQDKFFAQSAIYSWQTPMKISLGVLANLVAYNGDEIATDLLIRTLGLEKRFPLKRGNEEVEWKDKAKNICQSLIFLKDKMALTAEDSIAGYDKTFFIYGNGPRTNSMSMLAQSAQNFTCFTLLLPENAPPMNSDGWRDISRRSLKLLK